jgi:hypothetical protein
MDWFKTLTIINSVALAVFLLLGIVAMIKAIKVIDRIKEVSLKAESLVGKAGNVANLMQGSMLTNLAAKFAKSFRTKK